MQQIIIHLFEIRQVTRQSALTQFDFNKCEITFRK